MNEKVLEILKLVHTLNDQELKLALEEYYEPDILDAILEMNEEDAARVKALLDTETHGEILTNLEDEEVSEYVEDLTDRNIATIVSEMESSEAHIFLDNLDEERRENIIKLLPKDMQEDEKMLSSYSENEVGQFINTDFLLVDDSYTIAKAMRKTIAVANETDNFTILYVNYQDGTFRGIIELKELIIARKTDDFVELIKENYPKLHDTDELAAVKEIILDYSLDSYPILDKDNHILGILTADQAKILVENEYQEDFNQLAGLADSDINEKPFKAVIKRLPWLLTLLVMAIIISIVSSSFEERIALLTTVVFFQSMIADMAGNVGTQALAITISRDFKKGKDKEKGKTIGREFLIGMFNGILLAIVAGLVVLVAMLIIGKTGPELIKTIVTVMISIFGVSSLSSLIGTAFPILLINIGVDPAVASGPFITTFNDVIAVLLYYGLAILIF